jgi:site-specific DNA-methyltransferase (cytosine-N4-specific)
MKTNYTLIGDVREKLKELPDKSIQMCVTSPPYYALRDYGTAEWEGGNPNCDHIEILGGRGEKSKKQTTSYGTQATQYKNECKKCNAKRKDNQLGLEKTPEEFVENMVKVFAEVHRVLRDDGTLWLNLGDSYLKNKQLGFIPQKVAIALQEWGWILRQDIIWAKKNCMPESVKDRFTKSHEYIFLFSKQPKYFFNQMLEPVKQKDKNEKRNKRSVWNMRTASYKEAHFAVFPPELAETCIKAGSNEKDIVLDCFMGSGTTAMVAQDLFRKWIGVELNPEYKKLIRKRTSQQVLF